MVGPEDQLSDPVDQVGDPVDQGDPVDCGDPWGHVFSFDCRDCRETWLRL